MSHVTCVVSVASLLFLSAAQAGSQLPPAWAPRAVTLNGTWDILPGNADADVWKPEVAEKLGPWGTVPVPAPWARAQGVGMQKWAEVPYVWYRRTFDVPAECRQLRTVLRLAAVRWGSRIWINGAPVGEHLGAFGVNDFDVTDALKPGETNTIVMRLTGWTELPRSAKLKQPLIAPGSAPHGWGYKSGGVSEFIELRHYDEAFLRWARIQADPATGRVTAGLVFRNYGQHFGRVAARLEIVKDGRTVATAAEDFGKFISLPAKTEDQTVELAATVPDVKLWSPDDRQLYEARVTLSFEGEPADSRVERFGFRSLTVKDRAFCLNGERIFLRGTDLYGEYVTSGPARFPDDAAVARYLSDLPKMYHGNCIRTHSLPMTEHWLRIADEVGMMILQEFPLTVNYDTFDFTPEEFATFRGNVEREYATMIELYRNHPSIVMWVPTNESPRWEPWENGPLYEMFRKADASRLVMRAGRVSPDIYDTHCYDGFWSGSDGDFDQVMAELAAAARRAALILTNTEYIENCNLQRGYRFLGPKLDAMSRTELRDALQRLRGEIVAEQTEVLRRLGCQLILQYAGHNVDNWLDPKAASLNSSGLALRSAFAPVAVTIDLFDRHFVAGGKVAADVVVMSGVGESVAGELQLSVLRETPPPTWDGAAPAAAVWDTQRVTVAPFEHKRIALRWPLPAAEGGYVLAAVWRCAGQEPSMSLRPAWALAAPRAGALAGRRIAVFEADDMLSKWLAGFGAKLVPPADAQLAVVGPHIHRSGAFPAQAAALRRFVEAGGRLAVLEQSKWVWDDLLKVEPAVAGRRSGMSAVFFKDRPGDPMWRNVSEPMLRRFNGLPGTICRYELKTDEPHEVLAVGASDTSFPEEQAAIRVAVGKGEIVFCNLQLLGRAARGEVDFDPVAERILLNMMR